MAAVPILKTGNVALDLYQSKLKSELDPLLANKLTQGSLLQGLTLNPGVNVINHKLQRMPQGWFVVDINGNANIWRSAPFTNLTLTLTSSAASSFTISLWVF